MNDDRRMELEIEVPGTPEEVWEAIATGPGITSWLHPTEVEEREGGELSFDMGGDMQFTGRVAGWDPPRRFVEETEWKAAQDEPPAPLATEWMVEARSGGTCVVRMVTTGFGTGAAWDEEIEGFTGAMRAALDVLRAYLTHFPRRHGSWMRAFGQGEGSLDEVWSELTGGPRRRRRRGRRAGNGWGRPLALGRRGARGQRPASARPAHPPRGPRPWVGPDRGVQRAPLRGRAGLPVRRRGGRRGPARAAGLGGLDAGALRVVSLQERWWPSPA